MGSWNHFNFIAYQPGSGNFSGHWNIDNGQLSMFGVCLSQAVAGWTAFWYDCCDLHPLTTLHRAEGKRLSVIVGFHLQEEEAARHTINDRHHMLSLTLSNQKQITLLKVFLTSDIAMHRGYTVHSCHLTLSSQVISNTYRYTFL